MRFSLVTAISLSFFFVMSCGDSSAPKKKDHSDDSDIAEERYDRQNCQTNNECSGDERPGANRYTGSNSGTTPPTTTQSGGALNASNDPQKAICDQGNKMYDRGKKNCYPNIQLDMSWCGSKQQIVNMFELKANAGNVAEASIDQNLALGFEIDQCGFRNNLPVVSLYKSLSGSPVDLILGGTGTSFETKLIELN